MEQIDKNCVQYYNRTILPNKRFEKKNINDARQNINISVLKIISRQHLIKNYPKVIRFEFDINFTRNLRSNNVLKLKIHDFKTFNKTLSQYAAKLFNSLSEEAKHKVLRNVNFNSESIFV